MSKKAFKFKIWKPFYFDRNYLNNIGINSDK